MQVQTVFFFNFMLQAFLWKNFKCEKSVAIKKLKKNPCPIWPKNQKPKLLGTKKITNCTLLVQNGLLYMWQWSGYNNTNFAQLREKSTQQMFFFETIIHILKSHTHILGPDRLCLLWKIDTCYFLLVI